MRPKAECLFPGCPSKLSEGVASTPKRCRGPTVESNLRRPRPPHASVETRRHCAEVSFGTHASRLRFGSTRVSSSHVPCGLNRASALGERPRCHQAGSFFLATSDKTSGSQCPEDAPYQMLWPSIPQVKRPLGAERRDDRLRRPRILGSQTALHPITAL